MRRLSIPDVRSCSATPPALGYLGMADRPNLLFIMSDDHASHAISAYDSRINRTPQLDRIAEGGHADGCRLLHQLHLHA